MNVKQKPEPSPIPDELLAEMLIALPLKAPSTRQAAKMKKSVMTRIGKRPAEQSAYSRGADLLLVRATEGRWINLAPSVDMKVLRDDGTTRTWLARFGPGGCVPAHDQSGDEEAIIMQGWCTLDELEIHSGDYHMIKKGTRHGRIHSPEGCLIFVRSHGLMGHASRLAGAR